MLERLIDQELALQKAGDQKLDRDPRVVQQIEAARREIISRAYLEKIGEGAPKPTPAEVSAYYEAHPALFKERRVYSFQEVNIEAKPEQIEALKKALSDAKNLADFVDYLKANNYPLRRQRGGSRRRAAAAGQRRPVRQDEGRPGDLQHAPGRRPGHQPGGVAIAAGRLGRRRRRRSSSSCSTSASESSSPTTCRRCAAAAKIEYVGDFAADADRVAVQAAAGARCCRR